MPVVVPQDTRWGDLGAGLGQLGAAFLQARQEKAVREGVSAILADKALTSDQKSTVIQGRYGQAGLAMLDKMNQSKILSEKVEDLSQDIQEKQATAKRAAEMFPLEKQAAQAGIAQKQQETAKSKVETESLLPAEAAQARAAASSDIARAKVDVARLGLEEERVGLEKAKIEGSRKSAQGMLDAMGQLKVPPAVMTAARGLAESGETTALASLLDKYTEKTAIPKTSSSEPVVRLSASAEDFVNLGQSVIDNKQLDVTRGLAALGEQWAVDWGLLPGTPAFNKKAAELQQAVYTEATGGGGGFGGEWKTRLAYHSLPHLGQSGLHNVVVVDVMARHYKAQIENRLRGLGDNENKAPLEDALRKVNAILEKTSTVTDDKFGNVYFQGSIVDPMTMKPAKYGDRVLDPTKMYSYQGQVKSGAEINNEAMKQKKNVLDVVKAMKDTGQFYEVTDQGGG